MRARRLLWLAVVFALVMAACGDDDADTTEATDATQTTEAASTLTQTPGVLTVGSDIPYPPFEDFDDAGGVIGFDADLIEEIASRLGLEVEWVDTDFDTIFTQLAVGTFDVVASATTITAERAQQVNFSMPYYNAQQSLAVNLDLTPGLTSVSAFGEGNSVGVQTGTTGADWAAENLGPLGVDVVEFPAAPDTYNALEAGQVDGVVNDEPSAVAEVANRAGLSVVEAIDTNEAYGFGVDPAREELLSQMDAALQAMIDDGTYQTIYDAWFDGPFGAVTYEAPEAEAVGTEENPIQVVYVPSTSAEEIVTGGNLLATALNEATGLFFEVEVPTSYAATIEAMCAAPLTTIGFIPANAYVLGDALCGMDMPIKSERFGYEVYWTAFLTARDGDINSIEDIDGRTWTCPDVGSTSGWLTPTGLFVELGISPDGECKENGGSHSATARAIYNAEADFATVFYSPIIDAEDNPVWDETIEGADIPADLLDSCGLDADGELECSGLYPRDARRNIREEAPDVIQKIKIFHVSDPIPNDGLAFVDGFDATIKQTILDALFDFAANDPDAFETAFDAYSWTSVSEATDAEFDTIRLLIELAGYDLEALG